MPRISGDDDDTKLLKQLGLTIRLRRKALKLSQESLADLSGVDRSHMGKIERGERNVTILNVARIAVALQCPVSELLASAGH